MGRYRSGLSRVRPDDLAAHTMRGLLERNGSVGEHVEEVLFGSTNQAGEDNRNVARMSLLLAGLPYETTGVTVNRLCGSGMEAIVGARRAIAVGDHEVIIAGGVESMTRAPYSMAKPVEGFPRTPPKIYDTSIGWRYPNPKLAARFELQGMGVTAENVAEEYRINREDQDAFALHSHQKAAAAWEAGAFDAEVLPVEVPPANRKAKATMFERDESIRPDSSLEALAKLRPVFREGGSVTAGNSSPLNDGASALLLSSASWAKAHGVEPMARVVASAVAGVHPNVMGTGPIPAIKKLLAKTGLSIEDIGLVELNEAFAAQSLACIRELGLIEDRVNVNGGAIAIGPPIGCSGARIVAHLAHAMKARGVRYGMASLCIGVGQGLAMILEREV
jgi:3-oxoadipyl-CoA thiolase